MENTKYIVWLTSIPGIGSVTFSKLLDFFGNLENIWNANKNDFLELPIKQDIKDKIMDNSYKNRIDSILDNIYKNNIQIITKEDNVYPQKLKFIKRSPPILFLKGNSNLLNKFSIAIVGSRNCSEYGKNISEMFATKLSNLNITIISGMACGIDSIAHKSSLKNTGRTIAVLGSGFDNIYPSNNKLLFDEIIQSEGAVITEYLPDVCPLPGNFPARNRIVSGLSDGIIVVEAREKSGALITAKLALEQGKEVFCIPGNIDTLYNKGGNLLIKKGVKIATSVDDILKEYPQFTKNKLDEEDYYMPQIDINLIKEEYRQVFKYISTTPTSIEEICRDLSLNISNVNSTLTMLELEGYIKLLPGNKVILNNSKNII